MSKPLSERQFPAKCPTCFGEDEDCEKCAGTGEVAMGIAAGELWTRHCNDCNIDNGVKVRDPEATFGDVLCWDPTTPPKDSCFNCGSDNVVWLEIGRTD